MFCHSVESDSATAWSVAHQVPLSVGFSRKKYWSGLPFPTPRDLPSPGIKLHLLPLLNWQAYSLTAAPPGKLRNRLKKEEEEEKKIFQFLSRGKASGI